MHVTIIDNKRGREFEREQGGLCGKVWSEKKGNGEIMYL